MQHSFLENAWIPSSHLWVIVSLQKRDFSHILETLLTLDNNMAVVLFTNHGAYKGMFV